MSAILPREAQAPYAVSWRLEVTKNCFNPSTPECNACMCKSYILENPGIASTVSSKFYISSFPKNKLQLKKTVLITIFNEKSDRCISIFFSELKIKDENRLILYVICSIFFGLSSYVITACAVLIDI